MDLKIKGRAAIVTGAGDGIGKATAFSLAREGARVCLVDIDEQKGAAATEELRSICPEAIFITADISNKEAVSDMMARVHRVYGSLDILINNAGISFKVPFEEITPGEFEKVVRVNLLGTFLCAQEAFSYMKAQRWGRIINLSSLAGRYGGINAAAHYSASKAGILGLTMTLAKKMGEYNITVNAVAPGRINTRMTAELPKNKLDEVIQRTPLRRIGTVEEVGDTIAFLASEPAGFITGTCVDILGGYTG